jgi:hypothetical protein
MLSFRDFLSESLAGLFHDNSKPGWQISQAAMDSLSASAKYDLLHFLQGTHDAVALDSAFRSNNSLAKEIYAAFEPVREMLRKSVGPAVTLYRVQPKGQFKFKRTILSFADEDFIKKFTRSMDHDNDVLLKIRVPVKDIVAVPVMFDSYREFICYADVLPAANR